MNQLTSSRNLAGPRLYRMGTCFLAFLLMFSLRGISAPIETAAVSPELPSKEVIANMTKEQKEARFEAMKERVAEIKAMDRSKMTRADRKALRMELRQMNKEARSMGYTSGIYISVGALIIIILLLIIIL